MAGWKGSIGGRFAGFWVSPKAVETEGMTNRVYFEDSQDVLYCSFLDYDGIKYSDLKKIVLNLQYKYRLGSAFIFETQEDSYHVIFPTITTKEEQVVILMNSNCDKEYVNYFMRFGERTLRTKQKGKQLAPKFKCIILADTSRMVSSAHLFYTLARTNILAIKPLLDSYRNLFVKTRCESVKYKTVKYR